MSYINRTWLTAREYLAQLAGGLVQVGRSVSVSVTRPDNVDPYTALDVIGTAATSTLTFNNVSVSEGGYAVIMGARLRMDTASVPAGMGAFRLHLYSDDPTAIADNAAYNLPAADRAIHIGWVDIPAPEDLGDTIKAQDDNLNVTCSLLPGSRTIYGILQTIDACTIPAETNMQVTLNVAEV